LAANLLNSEIKKGLKGRCGKKDPFSTNPREKTKSRTSAPSNNDPGAAVRVSKEGMQGEVV